MQSADSIRHNLVVLTNDSYIWHLWSLKFDWSIFYSITSGADSGGRLGWLATPLSSALILSGQI